MLLTLAEVSGLSTIKRRDEAATFLQEAMKTFRSLEETRYVGLVLLELATVHYHKEERDQLLQAAGAALATFASLDDQRLVGLAHFKISLAHVMKNDYKAAFQKAGKALECFRQANASALEVSTLCAMSSWHIMQDKPQEALAKAESALAIALTRKEDLPAREAKPLKAICEALGEMDRLDDAVKAVTESLERCSQANNKKGKLAAMDNLWQLQRAQEAYTEALDTGDEILELVKELQDTRATVKAYFDLHEIYMSKKDSQSAMESLELALDLVKELDDPQEESMILQWLANLRIYKEEYSQALTLSETVKQLALTCEDRTGEGASLLLTCGAHAGNAELEDALTVAVEAQELFKAIGNKSNEAVAWQAMAQIHMMNRKYDSGLHCQERALELWKKMKNKVQINQTMFEIALVHLMLKKHIEPERLILQLGRHTYGKNRQECNRQCLFAEVCLLTRVNESERNPRISGEALDKALRAANKAMTLADDIKDKGFKALALFTRAQVTNANGMPEKALELAEESRKIFKDAGHPGGEAQVMAFTATVHFDRGRTPEAEDLAKKALELAQKHGDFCAQETALELQESIEEKKKAQMVVAPIGYVPPAAGEGAPVTDAPAPESAAIVEAAKPAGLDPIVVSTKVLSMMTDMISMDEDVFFDTDVMETGIDSLSSMELVSQLSKEFRGFHLSPTLLFDFPTVREIGDHLAQLSLEA